MTPWIIAKMVTEEVYVHYAVIWPIYGTHECMTYHYMDPSSSPCLAIFLCKKQLGPSQHHLAYKLCMAMGKFLTLALALSDL